MSKTDRSRSLTQRTLWRVAVRIAVVVAAATVLSYWQVRSGFEHQALNQLAKYVEQRRARESNVFVLAADNLQTFAETYRRRLADAADVVPDARFRALFEFRPDGTTRLRQEIFKRDGVTGFIGKHVTLDDDLRRRLLVAYDALRQFGPAWRSRFTNLYVVTPENAVLMYWPDLPWALNAADWEVAGKLGLIAGGSGDVIVTGRTAALGAAAAGHRWSDLYFDYGVNDWMVSATEAVRVGDGVALWVGHDVLLRELFARTLHSDIEGTYSMILSEDGRLIAHPRYMEAIQARGGQLAVAEAGDAHLQRINDLALDRPEGAVIVKNGGDSEYLAVTPLAGPGWLLVTVFPQAIVTDQAFRTARLILLLGAAALLLEIGILFWVLRRQVAAPLRRLIDATQRIASGRFDADVAASRDDEIGQLARSFNNMAQEIDSREAALQERSARLAEVNKQLANELEERSRAEQEIARQREALYQSEKLNALGSLLAGVAHELNNPLSVVVGRSILLEEQLRESEHGPWISKIRGAAERCARIVKTFLSMARQQEPSRQSVAIADVLHAAQDIVDYGLRRDDVAVSLTLEENLPPVSADPNQLVQVFTNLFLNAQQAMAEQDPPRRIAVDAGSDPESGTLVVDVRDNGPGIPQESLKRIFEPFYTTKPVGEGTGLGLSVCRGLVEAHGGSITVELPAGGGTLFRVRLPVEGEVAASDAPPQPRSDAGAARRILVVEDEPEIANLLAEVLQPLGHTVEIAHTGESAYARLRDEAFDLILSDLRLPDLDGGQLYRRLQARSDGAMPRMIFVTGDSLSEKAERFLHDADCPVIEKPFTPEEIRRAVASQLAAPAADDA